jgi:hypothetical protein
MTVRLVWSAPTDADLLWALWSLPLRLFLQNLIWLRGPVEKEIEE